MTEFVKFPKLSRVNNQEVTITEKVDGTNACIAILPTEMHYDDRPPDPNVLWEGNHSIFDGDRVSVFAQSRKRFITPEQDNYNFAKFVQNNAPRLVEALGMGRHFGEWAGTGIQRGYAIEKTFFLFDPWRYDQDSINDHNLANESTDDPYLDTVPVLWQGKVLNLTEGIDISIGKLLTEGSHVGYATPEGLVVRAGAQVMWKLILEPDGSISETPKGVQ